MLSRRIFSISFLALAGLAACHKAPKVRAPLGPKDPMEPGGAFHLVDQDGKPVDDGILKGKWTAVYFGYTFCPDVCPTTLQALAGGLAKLGSKGKDVQTLFISIDPERDTPAQLKSYISSPVFPRPILGLTGTADQVAEVAKAYKVYYAKAGTGSNYLMDHQSIIYLMNPDGRLAIPLTHDLTPDQIARQIGDAMAQNA
jgi:protein SCO1/2